MKMYMLNPIILIQFLIIKIYVFYINIACVHFLLLL
jgi:hypothetical protein